MTQQEILSNLNIDALNAMQQESIDAWRRTRRIVLLAPTGSGKTLAYLLPLVQELQKNPQGTALVLAPSRELAQQTTDVVKQMRCGIQAVACYGGRPAMDEHRVLRQVQPRIIVATPGRAADHLRKGNIDGAAIETIVLDEFDKCLELGFRDEMSEIIGMLPNIGRRFLLSATDSDQIPAFAYAGTDREQGGSADGRGKFVKLDFTDGTPDERLPLHLLRSAEKDKLEALRLLLLHLGDVQSMVFVNHRESVERVAAFLRQAGAEVSAFHGGMEQRDRERALYRFANGSANVLVSTDLAARGLDIEHVASVIHYHLPLNDEAFTHRNGRATRWDRSGEAWVIVGPDEQFAPTGVQFDTQTDTHALAAETAHRVMPTPRWTTLYIGKGKKDKVNRVDVVGFLTKVGGLQRDELGRIDVADHFAFAAVARHRVHEVLSRVRGQKIKGQRTIVEVERAARSTT